MAENEVTEQRLVVIGGSAGSLSMVLKMLPTLDLSTSSLIIVFHRKQAEEAVLLDILSQRTRYPVKEAEEKDPLVPGAIYVAPPDYHLLVERDWSITLDYSEKVQYSRPSIDVTFESAAESCGTRLTCLLLSGANSDGVDGLIKAKAMGARIVIQDPASAEVPFMPQTALQRIVPDLIINEGNLPTRL